MRRIVRLLLWSATVLAALIGLLFSLLLFVDISLFRAQLERQVSSVLGREVVFEGALELERSLAPRVTIRGVKIANPAWASRNHLASVDEFGVRVGLLPLLDGRLEIKALESVGVDLFIEVNEAGGHNLSTGRPTGTKGRATAPVIEAISLRDVRLGYRAPDITARSYVIERMTGRVVPGEPLKLKAQSTFNKVPIALSLLAEPIDIGQGAPAWDAKLQGEIGRLSLRVAGRVSAQTALDRGLYQVHIEGPDLDDLEALSGQALPDAEDYELEARVGFDLDDYLEVTEYSASIGDTDLKGTLNWDIDAPRPAIKMRLHSQRLDSEDLGFGDAADELRFAAQGAVERPFEGAGFDLRYELRGAEIERLLATVRSDAAPGGCLRRFREFLRLTGPDTPGWRQDRRWPERYRWAGDRPSRYGAAARRCTA
jgi:hypothetical protein